MRHEVEPEPTEEEREAILAALAQLPDAPSAWAETALVEGIEDEP